jgi:F-type H+-transporting ATPase subunit delta
VTNRTAATRYARAIIDVARAEQVDIATIDAQLTDFAQLVDSHDALRKALISPAVPASRKRSVIDELVRQAGLLPVLARTLQMLADRDRLVLLPEIATLFRDRLLESRNIVRAQVTTALPLTPERQEAIQRGLAAATGHTVDLTTSVDPSLLGGMVARVGSTVFDASIANHLQRIRQRLDASI